MVPDAAFRPQVMVPREYVTWLTGQPDDVLATRAPQAERFAMPYLVPTLDVKHERFTMDVVRKDPTRNLGRLQPDFFIDMRESVDSLLGLEEESWREIRLYEIMQKIIFKSTNRVLVGLPLCHNEDFLSSSAAFSQWLGVGAVIVGQLMPSILKPFFGYLMAIPIYLAQTRSFRYLVPVIRERMENIRRKRANPSFVFDKPNDMITWMVEAALNDQNTRNNRPEATAERILFLVSPPCDTSLLLVTLLYRLLSGSSGPSQINPVNVFQIQILIIVLQMLGAIPTAANTFLDLLSSPPELGYYKSLQEEAAAIFRTEQDWADSTLLGKFSYADSAIRESLRKNPVLTRVVLREVVRKEGLDMPDGHHLPRGTWIGVPAVGIHHDERFYHEPEIHDPFRFTRVSSKEAMSSHYTPGEFSSAGVAIKESKYRKPQGLSTTSDTYLAFGYGRHAW